MGTSTLSSCFALFLQHKACFTCIFAKQINPVLSEEAQAFGNKLECTESASMHLVRYQENELALISKKTVIDKALGAILSLSFVFSKEIWYFSSNHSGIWYMLD